MALGSIDNGTTGLVIGPSGSGSGVGSQWIVNCTGGKTCADSMVYAPSLNFSFTNSTFMTNPEATTIFVAQHDTFTDGPSFTGTTSTHPA